MDGTGRGFAQGDEQPSYDNSIQALATDTVTTYLMGASDAASRKVNDIESAQVTFN